MLIDPIISEMVRGFYLIIFSLAAFHKLSNFGGFSHIVDDYGIVPSRLARHTALAVIASEVLIVLLLVFLPYLGLILSGSLLTAYAILMTFNILRGRTNIDCGCLWGVKNLTEMPHLKWRTVFRNLSLVLLGIFALLPSLPRQLQLTDYINILAVCCVSLVAYQAFTTLLNNYNRMKDYGHV